MLACRLLCTGPRTAPSTALLFAGPLPVEKAQLLLLLLCLNKVLDRISIAVGDQNEMRPKLCLDRAVNNPDSFLENHGIEFWHHLAFAEDTEAATL